MKVQTLKPGYYGEGSFEVCPSTQPGEGSVRRCALAKKGLVTQPFEGIDTLHDVLAYTARTHGARNAFGWRDVIHVHEEAKEIKKMVDGKEITEVKKWKYFELSDYKFITFVEVQEAVSEIARGLIHLGITSEDIFNLFAQTSPTWQLMSYACASISTTIATAYDTLGEEGLTHSLNEPNCVGIFTNVELLPTLYKVLKNTPTVRFVIHDGDVSNVESNDILNSIKVLSLSELRELGKSEPREILTQRLPKPETIACIMYTSGSTGPPKGVVMSHANLVASVGAAYHHLGHHLTPDDIYIAYLPLAHVLEFIVEMSVFFCGIPAGFGRVKTLTDASVRNCKGDLNSLRPTIMVGVPAVWETVRKGILSKVNGSGSIKRTIFSGAMAVKKNNVPILSQLADSIVLSGVKAATGGRLRIALSGGAALNRETQEFLTTALVTLSQGYGMTESCGMCAILPPEFMRYETVGLPVPSVDVMLRDVPDAGYLSTNNPPEGEVCIRGPSVVKGYFKRPDLNEDENIFTKDGWLRTGDIGRWNKDGTLSLIDRLKNLIKLQSGEYIALERLETTYKACNLVSNICVHAAPTATQPMAIIIPLEEPLRQYLQGKGIDSSASLYDMCKNKEVQTALLKECNGLGRKSGFKQTELLQTVLLTSEDWTPENGMLTAAQKIQRNKIAKTFAKEIKEIYDH